MVGYTHGRLLEDSWHLNYIAVLPQQRGSGLGRILFENWRKQRPVDVHRLSLDVEESNIAAVKWYERHGFVMDHATHIYETPLQPPAVAATQKRANSSPGWRLENWPDAEAWQEAYGFSRFQLAHPSGKWDIGRLGPRYFQAWQLLPPAVHAVLYCLDASRSLLINTGATVEDAALRPRGVSLRMTTRPAP